MGKAENAVAEVVAEQDEIDGALVPVERGSLLDVLTGKASLEAAKPTAREVSARIVGEMLQAETEEELWAETPTFSSKELVGEVVEITGVRGVFESRFVSEETGERGWFVCFDAVRVATGEVGVFTSSAARICGRIGWYFDHGRLPQAFRIVSRGQSAGGFDLLDVEKA